MQGTRRGCGEFRGGGGAHTAFAACLSGPGACSINGISKHCTPCLASSLTSLPFLPCSRVTITRGAALQRARTQRARCGPGRAWPRCCRCCMPPHNLVPGTRQQRVPAADLHRRSISRRDPGVSACVKRVTAKEALNSQCACLQACRLVGRSAGQRADAAGKAPPAPRRRPLGRLAPRSSTRQQRCRPRGCPSWVVAGSRISQQQLLLLHHASKGPSPLHKLCMVALEGPPGGRAHALPRR